MTRRRITYRLKGCGAIAACFTVHVFSSQALFASDAVKIVNLPPGARLHMREAPDKNAKVVAYIPPTYPDLKITGPCDEKWCPITFRSISGWAYRGYLDMGLDTENAGQTEGSSSATAAFSGLTAKETGSAKPTALSPDPQSAKFFSIEGASADQPINIRETPDDGADIKGVIPFNGTQIEGLNRCVTKWCMIRYNGIVGWAPRRHLAENADVKARKLRVVNMDIAGNLPVKEFPAVEAADIGSIPSYAGGIVQIGACDKIWCHVRYLGSVGWVRSQFVAP